MSKQTRIKWSYAGDRKPVLWWINGKWELMGWLMPEAGKACGE